MVILLKEENKDLRGKLFPIPDGVKKHLVKTLSDYQKKDGDKNNDGYDRLVYLCDIDRITMEELKRIKNFFDNYNGTPTSDDYILNGGKPFSDWVNRILKVATDNSKNQKEAEELVGLGDKKQKANTEKPRVEKIHLDKIQTKNLSNSLSKNSAVKESRTIYLSEKQVNIIKEALNPETFSFEELERLCKSDNESGLGAAFKYCEERLGPDSGKGMGRAVFDLTDDKVLKVERNGWGWEQNEREYEMTNRLEEDGINIIPKIFQKSDIDGWMVCERVIPCRINDFDHILGIPYKIASNPGNVNDKYTKDFGNYTDYSFEEIPETKNNRQICVDGFVFHVENNGKYTTERDYATYEKLRQEPWFAQLAKLVEITGTEDLHIDNFGMAIRNGKPTIVVLDLGL